MYDLRCTYHSQSVKYSSLKKIVVSENKFCLIGENSFCVGDFRKLDVKNEFFFDIEDMRFLGDEFFYVRKDKSGYKIFMSDEEHVIDHSVECDGSVMFVKGEYVGVGCESRVRFVKSDGMYVKEFENVKNMKEALFKDGRYFFNDEDGIKIINK